MESPKSVTRTTVDVLSRLNDSPDAWRRIGIENARLSSQTGTEGEQAEAETQALIAAGELIGEGDFLDERATVIGLGRTAHHATLEPMAVDGRYDTITSLVNEDTGRGQLFVSIKTSQGKNTERYYFPLDDAALAHFEVDIVEQDGPRYITQLIKSCQQASGLIRSEEFRSLDPDEKQEHISHILEGINRLLRKYIEGSVIQVESGRYSQHIFQRGRYSVEEKNQSPRTLAGDMAKFILPAGSAEPILELVDSHAQVKYWIKPKDIAEIISANEEGDMQTIDLFSQWFGPEYHGVAYSLEVDLTYALEAVADTEEWGRVYIDAVEELQQELPAGDLLDSVYLTGFVFTNDGKDQYQQTFCDSNMVMIDGPEFIEIDGELKAVLSATTWDSVTKEEGSIYIVPSPAHLTRFESPMIAESRPYTVVSAMHQDADKARSIVGEPHFYLLPLDEQREILEIYSNNVADHLASLSEFFDDYMVDFRVTEYRCLPGNLLELGWGNPLVRHEKAAASETLSVVADTFTTHNPDIDNRAPDEAVREPKEFIFSDGEPMVVLESTLSDMYYLVKVRDVVHCSPIFEADEQ